MTVKQKQCLLAYLGYYTGAIDGIWGEKSRQATEAFQQAYGLKADGMAGSVTEETLRGAVAGTVEPIASGQLPFWDDIKYFRRNDPYIACPCGTCGGFPVEPSEKLMRLADRVREHFGAPMIPTSTVRCPAHNAAVGGVATSYHLRGRAMDFYIRGLSAATVLAYVQTQGVHYAYAIDGSAVHMDVS